MHFIYDKLIYNSLKVQSNTNVRQPDMRDLEQVDIQLFKYTILIVE